MAILSIHDGTALWDCILILLIQYWDSNNLLAKVPPQCKGKDTCPLGIDHPPNGFEEMSLGCSKCKMEEAGMVFEEEPPDDPDDYVDDDLFF